MRCQGGTPIFKKNWVRFCCISNTQRHSFLSTLAFRRQTATKKKIEIDRGELKEEELTVRKKHAQCFYFLIYELNLFLYLNGRKLPQPVRMLVRSTKTINRPAQR